MMSMQYLAIADPPFKILSPLSEGYRKWILVTRRDQLVGYDCSGQVWTRKCVGYLTLRPFFALTAGSAKVYS